MNRKQCSRHIAGGCMRRAIGFMPISADSVRGLPTISRHQAMIPQGCCHPCTRLYYINMREETEIRFLPLSLSKNLAANSKMHKCIMLMGRSGEPPARVPHRKTSHRDVLRPSCALKGKNFVLCGGRRGLCPSTLPPFEKGGRKLFVQYFLRNDFFDKL